MYVFLVLFLSVLLAVFLEDEYVSLNMRFDQIYGHKSQINAFEKASLWGVFPCSTVCWS
ncbi:MAG: hypothetical protein CM15mP83_1430 [Flavobacteriaceae bacterium]|nr:MAG: hypothetical protein CM15mP83_1430 [Flavobacteriaceae bacterium]